jgi:hypothetical protein
MTTQDHSVKHAYHFSHLLFSEISVCVCVCVCVCFFTHSLSQPLTQRARDSEATTGTPSFLPQGNKHNYWTPSPLPPTRSHSPTFALCLIRGRSHQGRPYRTIVLISQQRSLNSLQTCLLGFENITEEKYTEVRKQMFSLSLVYMKR